jgi:hypothetical protein
VGGALGSALRTVDGHGGVWARPLAGCAGGRWSVGTAGVSYDGPIDGAAETGVAIDAESATAYAGVLDAGVPTVVNEGVGDTLEKLPEERRGAGVAAPPEAPLALGADCHPDGALAAASEPGIAMIAPQTEQRARTPAVGTFAGSTRNTEWHSGHVTFIGTLHDQSRSIEINRS